MVVLAPDGAPAAGAPSISRGRSLGRALAIVGERWTLLVLRESFAGCAPLRAFQRNLGIARNILADRLHKLRRRRRARAPPLPDRRLATSYC